MQSWLIPHDSRQGLANWADFARFAVKSWGTLKEQGVVEISDERSRNLDRSFRNIYIIPSFPTREQHAHSVQNARSRFTKLNQ